MKGIKVGFILISNSRTPLPSTRIFALNMFPYLEAANYEPHISFEPSSNLENPEVSGLAERLREQRIEIAIFQKVHGASVLNEANKLSAAGIKTIYGVCDFIDNEMAAATDATIVVTDYLKSLYDPQFHHKIYVVHDGIEKPDAFKTDYGSMAEGGRKNRPLQAILVTANALADIPIIKVPPRFVEITVVGRYPPASSVMRRVQNAYWKVQSGATYAEKVLVARHLLGPRFKTINWDIDAVYKCMLNADIGIIPVDMQFDPLPQQKVSSWEVRSENRLTMKMSAGLPVIASPVPSYKAVIDQGKNGYLATTRDDWITYLSELRDPRLRQRIGQNARDSVLPRFSKAEQARKLIGVLEEVRKAK